MLPLTVAKSDFLYMHNQSNDISSGSVTYALAF